MKKFLICGLVLLSIFIIYLANMDKKVYYLALGDSSDYLDGVKGYSFYVKNYLSEKGVLEKYVYEYSNHNDRITDIIRKINDNSRVKDYTLKNSLVKADLVTITINIDDIFDRINDDSVLYSEVYDYIDDLTLDLEKLFKLMREYCKEDIIFIGYYNSYSGEVQDVINYLNKRYREICLDYDIKFVDISKIDINGNLKNEYYKKIGDKVNDVVNKSLFKG